MDPAQRFSQIRRTAARVLAKAVLDLHPKAYGMQGGETRWGFFFDFIFLDPFSKTALPLVEERMRTIAAQNLEIQIHEMVPSNAAKWMRYGGFFYPAHFAEISQEPLVQVIQMETFLDYAPGSFLRSTGELTAFKLLDVEKRLPLNFRGDAKPVYRIIGVADEGQKELKQFLKEHKKEMAEDHLSIGEKLGLFQIAVERDRNYFETAKLFWKSEGEALLHRFYSFWREKHLEEGFELVVTRAPFLRQAHETFLSLSTKRWTKGRVCFAEFLFPHSDKGFCPIQGLLETGDCHSDRSHIFCLKKELTHSLTRSVAFCNQTLKFFGCETSIEWFCPRDWKEIFKGLPLRGQMYPGQGVHIQWKFWDRFGKSWDGPFLKVQKKGEIFIIEQSFFSSVERMIALILERRG